MRRCFHAVHRPGTLLVPVLLALEILFAGPSYALDAFPGAQGFGREAQGGRGGRIIDVVNLDDSGPGSLRGCVLETGPRVCVFRVSGVIVLDRSLLIDGAASANLSILGQSAPGGGITLTVRPDATHFMRTPIILRNTHDVVVRYLRLRSTTPSTVRNIDGMTVQQSRSIYIDHVSTSWATDENFNADMETGDITVAYSIFGEGLRPHSKCALLGSAAYEPQSISFWRNLCISNNDRNPDDNHVRGSCVEITDNVFYNARSQWAEIFSQKSGGTPISFTGNYFKAGPSTLEKTNAIDWDKTASLEPPAIHASTNAAWAPPGKTLTMIADDTLPFIKLDPTCPPSAPSFGDPARTYAEVLGKAGAFPRDSVDRRFVREVGPLGFPGKGSVRKGPGVIEPVASSLAYVDDDRDGMADSLETQFGADPGVADSWQTLDDGWSSFDLFMQWLADQRAEGRYPG